MKSVRLSRKESQLAAKRKICCAYYWTPLPKQVLYGPGGRRFHFTNPSGNELAVMQPG